MLIGRPPFAATTLDELRDQILNSDADSTRAQRSDIAEYIDHIILKCLKRDRIERYGSFAEVLDALKSTTVAPDGAEQIRSRVDRVDSKVDVVQETLATARQEQADALGRLMDSGDEVGSMLVEIGAKVDRIAATSKQTMDTLMKESCEFSNCGEHERAYEAARKASGIASTLKDESADLTLDCLVHQGSIVLAAAADVTSSLVVDRLRQTLRELERLGTDTWQHAAVKLQLSRVLRNHDETIATSRLILDHDDAPIRQKVDALSALILALARLDRTPELISAAADIENLADRIDIDDQVSLRANWLLAATDAGLFERSAVSRFLECLTAASATGDLAIAQAADIVFMTGDALRKATRRGLRGKWLEACHEVFSTGYRLVEPTRDAHKMLTFSIQLAEIALDLGNNVEAETWLERADDSLAARARFETPEARLSHRCVYLFTKARIVMRISEQSDRARKESLLRVSLATFEETEALLEKSAGALSGEVDLMTAEIAQRKAIIHDRLGDYRTALDQVRKAIGIVRAMRDSDWAADVRLHEAELSARLGDITSARTIVDDLLRLSDLSPERIQRVRGFDTYLTLVANLASE